MSKNQEYFKSKENIERVSVQVGMTKRNVELTYANNKKGIDKSKMFAVLSLGAMCSEQYVSVEELKVALTDIVGMRQAHGIS